MPDSENSTFRLFLCICLCEEWMGSLRVDEISMWPSLSTDQFVDWLIQFKLTYSLARERLCWTA